MAIVVLGAGLVAVDHMFLSPVNAPGSQPLKYLGSAGGGSVGNQLCMLSLLGGSCSVLGVVGNDEAARVVRADFSRFGVNHAGLSRRGSPLEPRPTRQFSHVMRPNGSHSFLESCAKCHRPLRRTFQMTRRDLSTEVRRLGKGARLAMIDRVNGATTTMAGLCAEEGGDVGFDFSFPRYGPALAAVERTLQLSSFVKTQESVLRRHLQVGGMDGVDLWKRRYPKTRLLLVTKGSSGVAGFWRNNSLTALFERPAIPAEHIRDAAGAGDILFAAAIHAFLTRGQPTSQGEVERRVDEAQALASLSCSLYGARSLQRAMLNQRMDSSSIRDMAGRIVDAGVATNSFPPTIGLPPKLSNPVRLSRPRGCPVCGQSSATMRQRAQTVQISRNYQSALSVSHLLMSQAFEIGRSVAHEVEKTLGGPSMFVGSGGSLSAGVFGETALIRGLGCVAKAIPPYEIWNLEKLSSSVTVWLLSHGGTNTDILLAAEKLHLLHHSRVVVLTGSRSSKLNSLATENSWRSIVVEGQERGFVATSGLLSMIGAISGALQTGSASPHSREYFNHENLLRVFSQANRDAIEATAGFSRDLRGQHIVALGSGWGWPAVVDFESKVVEGGVCTIEISELKNFTHGRYVDSFHHREKRHFVLFCTPEEQSLAKFMIGKLERYFESITLVETAEPGLTGAVDLLVKSLYLAGQLAGRAGVDLASPRYPPEARGLYSWTPKRSTS